MEQPPAQSRMQRLSPEQIRAVYRAGEEAVVALVEALQDRIEQLERHVERLESRVSELEARLAQNSRPVFSQGFRRRRNRPASGPKL